MYKKLPILLLGLIAALCGSTSSFGQSTAETLHAEMVKATQDYIATLSPGQRDSTLYTFDSDERMNFNFVPMPDKRKGVPLKQLSAEQRTAVHVMLQSVLSAEGYLKTTSILQLERILSILEENPAYRDPEKYYVTIFGEPAESGTWGWRFEGHHVSLNFASVDGNISVTPAFMGTNPGRVLEGPFAGWQVLNEEINTAASLMATLSDAQRRMATIADTAPRDIITGNQRSAVIERFEGLPYTEMSGEQQEMLRSLVQVYLDNMKPEVANQQTARIALTGWDQIYFAWAGSLDLNTSHYYRVHSPTLLIEYDNTQNNANHPHTVWRDLTNDFGQDLLKQHYHDSGDDHGH